MKLTNVFSTRVYELTYPIGTNIFFIRDGSQLSKQGIGGGGSMEQRHGISTLTNGKIILINNSEASFKQGCVEARFGFFYQQQHRELI